MGLFREKRKCKVGWLREILRRSERDMKVYFNTPGGERDLSVGEPSSTARPT